MFQQLTILDIVWFISFSSLILLMLGNLFYLVLKRLLGDTYFRSVCDLLGLDNDILHKTSFMFFIGVAFYVLLAQAFTNGYFFVVASYLLIAVSLANSLVCIFRKWRSRANIGLGRYVWTSKLSAAIIVLTLGIIVLQRFIIVQGQYGTTADDGVEHSYIVHRILEAGIYQTAFGLKVFYTFGGHVIASLPILLLAEPTYKIALLSTVLFSILNFFAYYSLLSMLNLRRAYRYFAAIVFALFVHTSYTYISWGGLPSGIGTYLLICTIAFSTKIFTEQATRHVKKFFMFSIPIFGPLLATYPPFVILEVSWLILYPLFNSLSTKELLRSVERILLLFPALAVASVSFIGYLAPPVYSFFIGLGTRPAPGWLLGQPTVRSYAYDLNNMFSPTVFLNYKQFTQYLNIPFFTHVQGFFDLVFYGVMLSILVVGSAYLAKRYNHGSIQRIARLILLSYGVLVVVWEFNQLTFDYVFLQVFFPPDRIIAATSIFITLQYVLTIFLVLELAIAAVGRLLRERRIIFPSSILSKFGFNFSVSVRSLGHRVVTVILLVLLLSNLGVVISETAYAREWIDSNSVLTRDDLTLLQWMKEHLPSNSTVLIQWSDGGQYVPLVTDFRTIYPFGLPPSFQEDRVYQQVLQNLSEDANNPAVLHTLESMGVDYIYIGSKHYAKSSYPYISAESLRNSPFFQFIHGVGNASLFKLLSKSG